MCAIVSVIVPAAGRSRRMGKANKLLQPVDSFATLLDATLTAVAATEPDDVIVVTGHEHDAVAARAALHDATIIRNPRFAQGMGSSLKAGVAAARENGAVMIWPADMPFIRPDTVRVLRQKLTPDIVVRPVYLGQPGHPVLFGAMFREALLEIPDAEGARSLLADPATRRISIDVDDPGVVRDLDTPQDFEEYR